MVFGVRVSSVAGGGGWLWMVSFIGSEGLKGGF